MASSTVTVYRNGDKNYPGKKLVINRRQIRSFDAFLDKVTHEVKMKTAARAICTPTQGHRIKELDKIQTGGAYVAVGPENFKKLGYKDIREPKIVPKKMEEITPVRHSKLVMSGRARKVADAEATAHKIFYVFRNGDDLYPSRKVLLKKGDLSSMDRVLAFVTDKVHLQSGAVYCLCTLQGQLIKDPSELENSGRYVAVGHGKKFKKVAYSDHGAHIVTPKRTVTKPKTQPHKKTAPTGTKAKMTYNKRSSSEFSSKEVTPQAPEEPVEVESEPLEDEEEVTPQAPEEPVEVESEPLEDEEEDIQVPAAKQPVEETLHREEENAADKTAMPHTSERIIDSKEVTVVGEKSFLQEDSDLSESSSVYKASGDQKELAIEIKEDKDTVEDKPIDQQPAEQVTEEQIYQDSNVQQYERRDSVHE